MAKGENSPLTINLHVYDTEMQVIINPEHEAFYRNGAKLITDTLNTYAGKYKGSRSEKQILYMALIDIALHYEMTKERTDAAPFVKAAEQLTAELEEALSENNK